ncbi:MAG: hypothetical protein OES26_21945 [Gammaproteobacteria bacterium]|nr:hypothetical protein [Gammaproteobacteria bacterium]
MLGGPRLRAGTPELRQRRALPERPGSFLAFPDVRGAIEALDDVDDDIGLAEYLLEEAGVGLMPGAPTGA